MNSEEEIHSLQVLESMMWKHVELFTNARYKFLVMLCPRCAKYFMRSFKNKE